MKSEYITEQEAAELLGRDIMVVRGFVELGTIIKKPGDETKLKRTSVKRCKESWSRHTALCMESSVKTDLDIKHWFDRWPSGCRMCNGEGGREDFGSLYEPPSFNACMGVDARKCCGDGYCPRCNHRMMDVDEDELEVCEKCGWTLEGKEEDHSAPYVYEGCSCFDAEEQEWMKQQESQQKELA